MKRVDMTQAASFRAQCTKCAEVSPARTQHTVALWMAEHERQHRDLDAVANGPLIDVRERRTA